MLTTPAALFGPGRQQGEWETRATMPAARLDTLTKTCARLL
jgi:hypothetical protein